MNKKIILIVSFISLLITGCSDDNHFVNKEQNSKTEGTVMRERRSKDPFYLTNKAINNKEKANYNKISLNSTDNNSQLFFLGRSYKLEYVNDIVAEGVGFPVINTNRLKADIPSALVFNNTIKTEGLLSAFTNFESEDNKRFEKKIRKGGFKIGFKKFSFGARHSYTSTFLEHKVNSLNSVFGRVDVDIVTGNYQLLVSPRINQRIIDNYLDPLFIDELFNSTAESLVEGYGGLVMTNVSIGGRAKALYLGISSKNKTTEQSTKDLNTVMDASFTIKGIEATPDIDFSKNKDNNIIRINDFSEVTMTIKTLGGSYGISSLSVPRSIDDININLGDWAGSFNNKDNSVLIDVEDNSLYPISDFVRPANLKFSIEKYLSGIYRPKLTEPTIMVFQKNDEKDSEKANIEIVLVTRFGDALKLVDTSITKSISNKDILKLEVFQKLPFKNLKILRYFEPITYDVIKNAGVVYTKNITGDINTGKKYFDDVNGITYILLNNRIGFAYTDSFIIDTYDIEEWVDSMEVMTSKPNLDRYEIIAL